MARNTIYELSQTDASNINSLTGLLAADTQAPSTVDNTMRGTMAFIAEMLADLTGTTAPGTANDAAGTANALTVTANASFTTQAQGRRVSLKATADNTGAATLAVNSLTAKKIRVMSPSGADIDISAGMITDNGVYEFIYDGDADTGSGGWMLLNPTQNFVRPVLYVHKNGTNQALPDDTETKVTFATEGFDVGGAFDNATNYRWTPSTGTHVVNLRVAGTGISYGAASYIELRKNGSTQVERNTGTLPVLALTDYFISGNASDYYEIFARLDDTGSGSSISGVVTSTYWKAQII